MKIKNQKLIKFFDENLGKNYFSFSLALAMCPNMWAKVFGIMPLVSGESGLPDMVYVFPVPVCP